MTSALNEEPVIGIDLDTTPADNINSIPLSKALRLSQVKPIQHRPKLRVTDFDLDMDSSNPQNLGMASNFQDRHPSAMNEEDPSIFTQTELFPKKSSSPVSKMRSLSSPYFLNLESFKQNLPYFTSELTNRDDSPTNQSNNIINGTVVEEKNSVLEEEDISTNRELITPNLLKLESMKSNGSTTPRGSRKGNKTPKSKSKSRSSPLVIKVEHNKKNMLGKLG